MTEYIDDKDTPNNDNGVAGGPPEAGWPYAVKPAWIRELLDLWERDKLVTLLWNWRLTAWRKTSPT